jgi:hypothetical protein
MKRSSGPDGGPPRDRTPTQVDDGVGDSPLRPDELRTYRTDPAPERELEGSGERGASALSPGTEPRPWIVLGLVLLVAFLVILAVLVVTVLAG